MKDKIMKILNHPVKGIYFLGIVAVYFLIVLTDFSFSFYTFLAYGVVQIKFSMVITLGENYVHLQKQVIHFMDGIQNKMEEEQK